MKLLSEVDKQEIRKLLTICCVCRPPSKFTWEPQDWRKWKRRFRRYLESLQKALRSSNSPELCDNKSVKLLIHLLGPFVEETFLIIERNFGWNFDLSLIETIERLDEHFKRMMKNNIYVRLNFHRRMQMRGQSIMDYARAIEFLAAPCKFKESYDMMMRDKLVIGIMCDATREKMFAYDDILTYEAACIIALNEEMRSIRRPG